MREIKFRVWDKHEKKMLDNANVRLMVLGYLEDETCTGGAYADNLYEFMQYTGLKDKNGKEIYEGDLILLMERWYCAVEYDVENARFILNGEYVKNEDEVTHSSFAPYYQRDIVVIGNKFDNPELYREAGGIE